MLSSAEVEEIDAALRHLHSLGEVDFPDITPDSFPLPTLSGYLAGLGDELRFGRGFLLLRGLPRERYSLDDLARIYVGLGAHIGRLTPQSYQGELLGHVIDVSDIEAEARGYHAGGAQGMHTDNCDIVSLLCVRAARAGGVSRFVSAAAVHNRLLGETSGSARGALRRLCVPPHGARRRIRRWRAGQTGRDLLAAERRVQLQRLGQLSAPRGRRRRCRHD
ncbi:MAG TPA: TauD/TfdA family dioxygenase, partial [Steroidobacteraceae bacterium]